MLVFTFLGTVMTPNYIDSSSLSVAPWCDCSNSGNDMEECSKFLNFFKDNTCLSELKKKKKEANTQTRFLLCSSCTFVFLVPAFSLSLSLAFSCSLMVNPAALGHTTQCSRAGGCCQVCESKGLREQEIQTMEGTLCQIEHFYPQIKFWCWQPAQSLFQRFLKPGRNMRCEKLRQIRWG